jgi:hypothetical protein
MEYCVAGIGVASSGPSIVLELSTVSVINKELWIIIRTWTRPRGGLCSVAMSVLLFAA